MPPVREPGDGPEPLEKVEVRPGVWLKLNAADRAVWAGLTAPPDEEPAPDAPVTPKPRTRKK